MEKRHQKGSIPLPPEFWGLENQRQGVLHLMVQHRTGTTAGLAYSSCPQNTPDGVPSATKACVLAVLTAKEQVQDVNSFF